MIEASGESSCKGRENGDASTSSERPLKKARFAWQVKGKYHLKNETDESIKNQTPSAAASSREEPSASQSTSNALGTVDYLMKQDCTTLGSVMNTENSLLTPNTSVIREQQHYPRYTSSYERSNDTIRNNLGQYEKYMSMADAMFEDQCISQWQSRQMIKGCVDNTLNQVLESWANGSQPAEDEITRFLAFDFAEFNNHFPGDNSVENEGILMAISAHGLQNAPNNSNSNIEHSSTSRAPVFDTPSPIPSPMVSDDASQQFNNQQSNVDETLEPWRYENPTSEDTTPFAYYSEPSQSPYSFFDDNNLNSNTDSNGDSLSHFDFMNAAVSHAIKSKGLTASGTEYG